MRLPFLLITLAMFIAGCGNPARDPVKVGADAPQDAIASATHVRSHMSTNLCPPGTRPRDVDIVTGADAFIGIRNGAAESSSAASGTRRQQCVGY